MRAALIDYGSGNIASAAKALSRAAAQTSGHEIVVTADPDMVRKSERIILPGVGAFADCMRGLSAVPGMVEALNESVIQNGKPILGICVGMQVLFDAGVEHGEETAGLGVLRGRVEPLQAPVLPHMGWNTVTPAVGSVLFTGIPDGTRFYFVHSYAAHDTGGLVTTARHGEEFVAAVEDGVISATQFHPEKSGDCGATLLSNWLATL